MATQTTYGDNIAAAVAGLVANMVPATFISRNVETAAGIGFGKPVAQGAEDYGCILFASGTVLGITALERDTAAETPDVFAEYDSARVMTKGTIWVVCTTGCSAGDPVYVRPSNATFQDSSANSGVQIVGARWETSATAGNLAIIRLT